MRKFFVFIGMYFFFYMSAQAGHVYINATQVMFQTGTTTIQTFTIPPATIAAIGVPSNATRLYFAAAPLRNATNATGYTDAYVVLSSPSGAWGGVSLGESGVFGGSNEFVEHVYFFDVPNETAQPFSFNWVMAGTVLYNPTYGMNWTVNFIGYDVP